VLKFLRRKYRLALEQQGYHIPFFSRPHPSILISVVHIHSGRVGKAGKKRKRCKVSTVYSKKKEDGLRLSSLSFSHTFSLSIEDKKEVPRAPRCLVCVFFSVVGTTLTSIIIPAHFVASTASICSKKSFLL